MNLGEVESQRAGAPAATNRRVETPFEVEGNALLAAIVESSDDAIISKDLNGIIRSWNRGAERLFGYTAEEVIGHAVSILAVPDRAEEYLAILDRIKHGERVEHHETYRRTKDGRVLTVSLSVSPIRDASGRIIGASKIARDITAQKELEEVRHRLAAIVESSDDVIISKDLDGIIRSWNKSAERVFGYKADEVIGKHISVLAAPGRAEDFAKILDRIRRGERIDHYETLRRAKDGRVLTMSLSVSPIRDAAGRIIGASKIARDVTDQKRGDEIRDRLAAIVNSSDDAIISKDLNGIIQSWNNGAERLFGYTAEEAVGQHIGMIAAPDRLDEIPSILDRVRRGERIEHYETKRRTKNGRVLDISLTVSPVRNGAGEIVAASKIARDITERKRLERELLAHARALAARETYLHTVLESMPESIQVLGRDGTLMETNRAGLSMIEAETPDEAIGRCMYPLVDEPYRERFREINENVFQGGEGGALEFTITALKGARRVLETRVVPLRDEDKIVIGALSATRDITDRKRAEERLQASEARFRAAVHAVSSLIWTNNERGEMEGEQPGWAAFTGQDRAEYQGRGWTAAVHPDDVQRTLDAWKQAVAERRAFAFEHRVRRADGAYRLFSIRAVPVRDENGDIREWVGVHTDVTEERELVRERALALEREQRSRYVAELLNKVGPMLAAELDIQALTQKVTDVATLLAGAQFGALFHNVADDRGESYLLYTISGVPRERFSNFPMPRNTEVFAPTFAGASIVRSEDITKDPRYGRNAPYYGMPAGHLPVRSYLAVPVMSRSGEVLGGLFFGHEQTGVFTEQHEEIVNGIAAQAAIALDNARLFAQVQKSRDALARANEELRQANADLEQFAYSASHDLKEPLRHVAISSQMLLRRYQGKLDDHADGLLRFSVESARRMDALVSGLLAYTQIANVEQTELPPVDAAEALDQAVANLSGAVQESGATISRGELPSLRIRYVHLVQLFQNLVGNAIKYRGHEPPAIEIGAARDGSMWRVWVKDNGIGIEPQYADQIFGLFKRLHTAQEYAGTGIGLALCQRIVQRCGGRIWVESEGPGKGSSFVFALPDAGASGAGA